MLDEVDRMARLVEELRVLARSERPDFLTLEDVDVGTLVADIGRKAEALAEGVGRRAGRRDPGRRPAAHAGRAEPRRQRA